MRQDTVVSARCLKQLIRQSLHAQGFEITRDRITLHVDNKEALRQIHTQAAEAEVKRAESALRLHEDHLLAYIADGEEVSPERIHPRLIAVEPGTDYARLFRYARLHWSIPVSNGYGRRFGFVLLDENNGKLIGILGLSDPIFSLRVRDDWIGWDLEQHKQRLYHAMEAYVLGAVPPYSRLLCGKFVAMVATSCEVRQIFRNRYMGSETLIRRRKQPAELALVTTISALGRSSLYNRLKFHDRLLLQSVGYTTGWGTFHFANGVYEKILAFVHEHCTGTAKAERWGSGEFRSRKEVIRKCLQVLGFHHSWMLHHVKREVFVAPLARNSQAFLRGETEHLDYWDETVMTYFTFFRERWLLPRAKRDASYRRFRREEWRLWPT
jgi:Domain of unknown function (DUF4338)